MKKELSIQIPKVPEGDYKVAGEELHTKLATAWWDSLTPQQKIEIWKEKSGVKFYR